MSLVKVAVAFKVHRLRPANREVLAAFRQVLVAFARQFGQATYSDLVAHLSVLHPVTRALLETEGVLTVELTSHAYRYAALQAHADARLARLRAVLLHNAKVLDAPTSVAFPPTFPLEAQLDFVHVHARSLRPGCVNFGPSTPEDATLQGWEASLGAATRAGRILLAVRAGLMGRAAATLPWQPDFAFVEQITNHGCSAEAAARFLDRTSAIVHCVLQAVYQPDSLVYARLGLLLTCAPIFNPLAPPTNTLAAVCDALQAVRDKRDWGGQVYAALRQHPDVAWPTVMDSPGIAPLLQSWFAQQYNTVQALRWLSAVEGRLLALTPSGPPVGPLNGFEDWSAPFPAADGRPVRLAVQLGDRQGRESAHWRVAYTYSGIGPIRASADQWETTTLQWLRRLGVAGLPVVDIHVTCLNALPSELAYRHMVLTASGQCEPDAVQSPVALLHGLRDTIDFQLGHASTPLFVRMTAHLCAVAEAITPTPAIRDIVRRLVARQHLALGGVQIILFGCPVILGHIALSDMIA